MNGGDNCWKKVLGSQLIESVEVEINGGSDEKWYCEECYRIYNTTPDICKSGCDNKDRWWLLDKSLKITDNWYNLIKESNGFKRPQEIFMNKY